MNQTNIQAYSKRQWNKVVFNKSINFRNQNTNILYYFKYFRVFGASLKQSLVEIRPNEQRVALGFYTFSLVSDYMEMWNDGVDSPPIHNKKQANNENNENKYNF